SDWTSQFLPSMQARQLAPIRAHRAVCMPWENCHPVRTRVNVCSKHSRSHTMGSMMKSRRFFDGLTRFPANQGREPLSKPERALRFVGTRAGPLARATHKPVCVYLVSHVRYATGCCSFDISCSRNFRTSIDDQNGKSGFFLFSLR